VAAISAAQIAFAQVTINPTTRTVTTSNFTVTWNTGVDTEAITALDWLGGPNVTGTSDLDTCGVVQYFGNAWAPPDPESGGFVLVGGGTVTPAGTVAWSGQLLPTGTAQVTLNSNSTNCPPSSAGINVQTTYRFLDPTGSAVSWFEVQRVFDFTSTTFSHDFRPYLPRLLLDSSYTEVLYPSTGGTLAVIDATSCPHGCTGPVSAPGASALSPAWASAEGWFAMHNPTTLQGVVVRRIQSADPQGTAIAAQLWIDYDGGSTNTNASSFLLMNPAAGFTGGLVTEAETLCFYNSTIWTPSLIPPVGCLNAPITLAPASLTFPGQSVGVTGSPRVTTVRNIGTVAVTIAGITATGDFIQDNDCPASLPAGTTCTIDVVFKPSATGIRSGSVSIFDEVKNSPLILSLAGLGLATP
jgi:hypothetical protein